MNRTRRAALALTAALVLLSGCSDDSPASIRSTSSPSPSGSTPSKPTSEPTATSKPTTTPTQRPTTSPASEAPAGFSLDDVIPPGQPRIGGYVGGVGAVRVGRHPDFDRVVWQFRGRGRPNVVVRYVDEPRADGSGERVPVRGQAYLQVEVSRVGIPPSGQEAPPDASDEAMAGTVITDASAIFGAFEGYALAWIGIRDEPRPFRVSTLTNPTRVVVDVYSG